MGHFGFSPRRSDNLLVGRGLTNTVYDTRMPDGFYLSLAHEIKLNHWGELG